MPLPPDYNERVYAGVLGKIIGVYLGRPFEGWSHERIMAELGEITGYVHERLGLPLVVTDDDLSGTFTFLRALEDYSFSPALTPAQIGQTWLNYIVEGRTILWWGGMGNSTEHTAYLRLKSGISAPESGSAARNGKVVSEQIGAQIFIDGWGLVAPGDPELAADLARRAASVSHDGEAIYAAQVVAALVAQAFVEPDLGRLLDCAVARIPRDSLIAHLHADVREWSVRDGDWHRTRERIAAMYGYDRYGGNCHIVPNHALILLALTCCDDNFQRALSIVNSSGWDTDCNSANVGCIMGVKNGLAGIDAGPTDWRGPLADRLFLPTADGGRTITDAVTETYRIIRYGRSMLRPPGPAGPEERSLAPKGGARFHFELPGAVQGFRSDQPAILRLEHVAGHSPSGTRSLALRYNLPADRPARAVTPTFILPDELAMPGYALLASPSLYPGQTLRAGLVADSRNQTQITARLTISAYGPDDALFQYGGPPALLAPGAMADLTWPIPDLGGDPVALVGVELTSPTPAEGSVYLDYLGWDGTPTLSLGRPAHNGVLWRRAWVDAVDQWDGQWPEAYRLVQNAGTGLLIQGTREWADYSVRADITPHMAAAAGLAARVQGLRRYYALQLVAGGVVQLVKALDGLRVLAEQAIGWVPGHTYELAFTVVGDRLQAWVDGTLLFDLHDTERPLLSGAVGLLCTEGRTATERVWVAPPGLPNRVEHGGARG